VAEIRSMITTIALSQGELERSGPWLGLLQATGEAVSRSDAEALRAIAAELDELADDSFRPVAGALLVNLRNILQALDVVADAQPVEVPAPSALTT
jgi:hypothetical protein